MAHSGHVSRPKQPERREQWRQRISRQKASGLSVRAFCLDHQLSEHSFYAWRRELGAKPVSFALVETTKPAGIPIELVLNSGETLRIPADEGLLRMLLSALQSKPA